MLMLHQQPLGACGSASEDASHIANRCCSSGAVEQAARQSTGHMGTQEARQRSVATERRERTNRRARRFDPNMETSGRSPVVR